MKIEYLQMIQRVIERFSLQSSRIKTWCITLITGMVGLSFSTANVNEELIIVLVLIITTVFLLLDTYYLQLEKSYRKLYSAARLLNDDKVDFTMEFKPNDIVFENYKGQEFMVSQISCLLSKSIYLFYLPIYFILLISSIIIF